MYLLELVVFFAQTKYCDACFISPFVNLLLSPDQNFNMVDILSLWLHTEIESDHRLHKYLIR